MECVHSKFKHIQMNIYLGYIVVFDVIINTHRTFKFNYAFQNNLTRIIIIQSVSSRYMAFMRDETHKYLLCTRMSPNYYSSTHHSHPHFQVFDLLYINRNDSCLCASLPIVDEKYLEHSNASYAANSLYTAPACLFKQVYNMWEHSICVYTQMVYFVYASLPHSK